jgi:pSer/pThr/pTyr-binding forkhead associated (FHA) protein
MEILLSITCKRDDSVREVTRSLEDGLVAGRGAEEGILLEGADLSREHLFLTHEGSRLYVSDLSVNGTWINGKRLKKSVKTELEPEDVIEVPGYAIRIRCVEELAQAKPADLNESPASLSALPGTPNRAAVTVRRQGPLAALDPALQFLASFTFLEKCMFFFAISSLALLYAYAAS